MHKIKEILHKSDSDDKDKKDEKVSDSHKHSTDGATTVHTHGAGHTHAAGHTHTHVGTGATTTTTETVHTTHTGGHTHSHGDAKLHTSGDHAHVAGEKHIYHEREVVTGSHHNYKAGEDPTLSREVHCETRHDAGVTREAVGEAAVIKEKIKEVELHKVQPVIHRDREQHEIRHVVEPHQEFQVKDTVVAHREKDIDLGVRQEASTLETSRSIGGAPQIESTREIIAGERQHQELPAHVEEHVHKKVVEHIHPVIYKETLKPKVTEETHHVYETVREHPVETYEVRDVTVHGSGSVKDAERAFFAEHSNRGIEGGQVHASSHTHTHGAHTHTGVQADTGGHTTTRTVETVTTTGGTTGNQFEQMGMHHQNIGAHHVPAHVIAGHNTAYDAALCNQCTGDVPVDHSAKDEALIQKRADAKVEKDEKAAKKDQK